LGLGERGVDERQLANLTKMVNINVYCTPFSLWWKTKGPGLIGFCEGEGTFGYKHLVPYFLPPGSRSTQKKKTGLRTVLKAIESFLLSQQSRKGEKSKVTDLTPPSSPASEGARGVFIQ